MKYVLIDAIAYEDRDSVLMVRKNRPDWQAGKWNLPGGHIEPGETAADAAVRELTEETNIVPYYIKRIGTIDFAGAVAVFRAYYWKETQTVAQMTDEEIGIFHITEGLPVSEMVDSIHLTIALSRIKSPYFEIGVNADTLYYTTDVQPPGSEIPFPQLTATV